MTALGVAVMVAALFGQNPLYARSSTLNEKSGEGITLTISEGTGKTVKPIFASSYSNVEKRCRVETRPKIGSHIAALGLNIMGYTVGSDLQWYHVLDEEGNDGEGFNAWPRELEARGRNIKEAYGGELIPRKDQFGNTYPYWLDFMHTLKFADADFIMCPNIYSARLAYDGSPESLAPFWKEFDRMTDDVTSAGHAVPIVQLGTESQLYEDLFPNGAKDYSALCELLIPGIRKRLPKAIISADGSNGRNQQWDDAVASIDGVDALRLYLQIHGKPHNDYSGMRRRVNADLPEMVDDFIGDYPGKKIVLLQMALKNRHPYHHRVAHGLYLTELYVRLAKLNMERDNIIQVASQMNLRHIFSSDLAPSPPYFGMLAVKDIWGGLARNSSVKGTELVTFAVEKRDGHHVVLINTNEEPVTIDRVIVNGKPQEDFEVSGYHGELSSLTVSQFESLAMPAYSWASVYIPHAETLTPATGSGDIDREKAQAIQKRRRNGEELSAEDTAYLRRAKADQRAKAPVHPKWTKHLTPLTELGTTNYKGEDGGLYGEGKNEPPKMHLVAAMKEAAKVQPLDAAGKPSKEGKIGLLSVGMSNTTQEYSAFKALADADAAKSPHVVIVDGAQGGRAAIHWVDPQSPVWMTIDKRLKTAGLSARQIQVVWLKQATANPANDGEFPQHAKVFQENLAKGLTNLKEKFPNLRIVYLSSRIYAGYAKTALNPEPYAYEEAFSMRWLIQDQIAGKPELNYDAAKGEVKSPLLLWGPYLWADGETPRRSDGLFYKREDLSDRDGTHPSDTGRRKVADQLLRFLKTDSTAKSWFTGKS